MSDDQPLAEPSDQLVPVYDVDGITVYAGDCLDVLRQLDDASVDAVVTDPPYGLEFMGKAWDSFGKDTGNHAHRERPRFTSDHMGKGFDKIPNTYEAGAPFQRWCELWTAECFRVLKPGGHLLAFGGTRTWHRLACAVEDAGFEVRDSIAWLYGSGFPKSLDVSKAIDKAAGAERKVVGRYTPPNGKAWNLAADESAPGGGGTMGSFGLRWQGWGTALKPAFEPIVVARKPLVGTVAGNVLAHGTGALNIDGCRIEGDVPTTVQGQSQNAGELYGADQRTLREFTPHAAGRWPANVVLDESQADALDEQSGERPSGKMMPTHTTAGVDGRGVYGADAAGGFTTMETYGDTGGASRFFFIAREDETCGSDEASDPSTNTNGCTTDAPSEDGASSSASPVEQLTSTRAFYTAKADSGERVRVDGIAHPTVKPLSLMRWLVRLVTPPGGTVLEPFAGSGTTVEACVLEGFACVAIEREPDYLPLIRQRLDRRRDPVSAVRAALRTDAGDNGDELGLFGLLDTDEGGV